MSIRSTYDRLILGHPRLVVFLTLAVLAFCFYEARYFKLDASSDALLLENDPDLRYYTEIKRYFGSDEFLILTFEPNGELFSQPVLAVLGDIVGDLKALDSVDQVHSVLAAPLFHSPKVSLVQLATGYQTLQKETVDLDLAVEELTQSELYRNFLISPDGKVTAIQVTFKKDPVFQNLTRRRQDLRYKKFDTGLSPAEEVELATIDLTWRQTGDRYSEQWTADVAAVRAIMARYQDKGKLFLGGVPMIVADMIDFIRTDLVIFGIGVIVFLIMTLGLIFRSPRWVLLPMLTCVSTGVIMIGMLGWTDWRATVISSNFLLLLFIITMSMAIHFAVRYRNRQASDATLSHRELVLDAAATVAIPCLYCTLTTMVGFGSLLVSGIKPVIEFGRMMAYGIGVAYLVVFLFLPAMMMLLPLGRTATAAYKSVYLTDAFARLTHRRGALILVVCMLFLIAGVGGIASLSVENRFIDYFKQSTEIYRGMEVIDGQLGGTTPLEIILEGEGKDFWWRAENRERLRGLHQFLESQPEVGKVLSLDSVMQVAEKINDGQPINGFLLGMMRQLVPADLKVVVIDPYINDAGDRARLELRVRETYKDLKREALIDKVESYLAGPMAMPAGKARLTGLYVLYNNLLQSLFTSQILTIGVVFLATWLMFCILFRSAYLATIALIPNIFPVVFVLGTLGWLGIPLDIMTITIAAITIGIAVDHTIHYVVCFKREFQNDGNYVQTMYRCHGSIGRAMYYTSLTIIFGFSILALSNFIPNIYFGLFTGLAMTVALVAAMTLLPKLIIWLKPLGRENPANGAAPAR